ncbi:MAG: 4-hydroxy-3-methylbut-2-enyl diphosphate reductase [Lentisphaerae bacterium]|nr:4-hydroxy-3-methylbut-2-enyl diphosphate reductase [Lentisphaerota bacterium]
MKGKIYLAEKRGFCSGVERAVKIVSQAVEQGPYPVRVLHEIVHNENVVNDFISRGVEFYEEPDPAWNGGCLIFSAHGVGEQLENSVRSMPVKVIDATCPLVKRLHAVAVELEKDGFTLLMAGKRAHRETDGVIGRVQTAPVIFENASETATFEPEPGRRYAVISQTTLSTDEYEQILERLRKKIPDLHVAGGICQATTSRQAAVKKLSEKCRRILVIGSTKSSNSKRLREVAESAGADAVLISDVDALPESFFETSGDIGITSGASAPEHLVNALVQKLLSCGWVLSDQSFPR